MFQGFVMKLRSGKVYDSTFPFRAKAFMSFHNPRFVDLWVNSISVYVSNYKNDCPRLAQTAFRKHMLEQVKLCIGYVA